MKNQTKHLHPTQIRPRTFKVASFLLFSIIVLIAMILASSCSPQKHARRLVRQGYRKLERAQKIDPSVIDSIKGVKDIEVFVPGDSGKAQIDPELDSSVYNRTMDRYDSALLASDSLRRLIQAGTLTNIGLENAMAELRRNSAIRDEIRSRAIRGFLKDSIYTAGDSLVGIDISIRGGVLSGVKWHVKDRTVKTKVDTTEINLDGSVIVQPWRQSWFYIMGLLIIVLLLVIIVLLKR
jgi:hypothetical protein